MIEIKNLHKSFGNYKAVDDVSLSIKEGEVFGIIGESGSGKSTLLRCINGLIPVDSGSVNIDGVNVQELPHDELLDFRKNIGMIFQQFSLVNRLNVYQNISLPLKIEGVSEEEIREKVSKIVKIVGLDDKLENRPSELSGGQKQRVAIARALVTDPKIILSDESTSALDPQNTESILNLFKELNRELKVTIVMVSHELDAIRSVCDRVMKFEKGKIRQICTPEELIRNELHKKQIIFNEEQYSCFDVIIDDTHDTRFISALARELGTDIMIYETKGYKFKDKSSMFFRLLIPKEHGHSVSEYMDSFNVWWCEYGKNK